MTHPVAITRTGLVTSVGLTAAATCAAVRAGLTNPFKTRFIDSKGEWIMAHRVPLAQPWVGVTRLAKMAAMAIAESLDAIPESDWSSLPVMLCTAERERPGRADNLDEELLEAIVRELGTGFSSQSLLVPHGHVSVAIALDEARKLIHEQGLPRVLIVAVDSLLSWGTITHFERSRRLLTPDNSNGFMAGEGAGALLVSAPDGRAQLLCTGIGFAEEAAHIDSDEPLRADGLTKAIMNALAEAGVQMGDMDMRITDLSGEQYYFKEASLALSRTLRTHKEEFPIWHPAECIGEPGAVAGAAVIAVADAAARKDYAVGPRILAHMANDSGRRAALTLEFGATP